MEQCGALKSLASAGTRVVLGLNPGLPPLVTGRGDFVECDLLSPGRLGVFLIDLGLQSLFEFFLFLELIGFLIILVLLFKSGNPEANKWGSPNKRMQSDAAEPRR